MRIMFIYTDGSKTVGGAGCAFHVENVTYAWTLHPMSSVYFEEQFEFWQALLYCAIERRPTQIVIGTESRSVLKSIEKIYDKDPMTKDMKSLTHSLQEKI